MKLSNVTATKKEGILEVIFLKKKTRVFGTNACCSNGYEDSVEKKPSGERYSVQNIGCAALGVPGQ